MRKLIENCEFKFKCPLKWEFLSGTGDEKVRFCGECGRKVFFCENDEELRKHSEIGECVAIKKKSEESDALMVGEIISPYTPKY